MKILLRKQNKSLTAGLLYLALIVVGMYTFVYLLPQIKVTDNISQTLLNISNNQTSFRFAIGGIIIMNLLSIWLAFTLKRIFTPIQKNWADIMFYFLLPGAVISLINEVNHYALLIISVDQDSFLNQKDEVASLFIDMHNYGAHLAVLFWGIWLFPLGGLVYKLNTWVSKTIGVTLILAGIGYLIDSYQVLLTANGFGFIASDFTFFGEMLLAIWLLLQSKHIDRLVNKTSLNQFG